MYLITSFREALLSFLFLFFFNDTATTEIYTLSLHDALPISTASSPSPWSRPVPLAPWCAIGSWIQHALTPLKSALTTPGAPTWPCATQPTIGDGWSRPGLNGRPFRTGRNGRPILQVST